jgi:hypothetical protein
LNRFDRARLLERAKLAISAFVVGGATIFAVYELYGAWSNGTIRTRRHGIASIEGNPEAFWFTVSVCALFVAMVIVGAVFMSWARSIEKQQKAPAIPMEDQTKVRKFEP